MALPPGAACHLLHLTALPSIVARSGVSHALNGSTPQKHGLRKRLPRQTARTSQLFRAQPVSVACWSVFALSSRYADSSPLTMEDVNTREIVERYTISLLSVTLAHCLPKIACALSSTDILKPISSLLK